MAPMDTSQKLYNAARSYCINRLDVLWSQHKSLLSKRGWTVKLRSELHRLQILKAILIEIERLDPEALAPSAELVQALVAAGNTATLILNGRTDPANHSLAVRAERRRFVTAVREMSLAPSFDCPMHPYRRVLSTNEVESLWDRAGARWGADGSYFYPLVDSSVPSLLAFDANAFWRRFPLTTLHEVVRQFGPTQIYELRERGAHNYLLSVDVWEPAYGGAECFCFAETLDWIMYVSHEDSVTT